MAALLRAAACPAPKPSCAWRPHLFLIAHVAAGSKAVIVDDGKRKCSAKRAETERLPRPDTPSLRHSDTGFCTWKSRGPDFAHSRLFLSFLSLSSRSFRHAFPRPQPGSRHAPFLLQFLLRFGGKTCPGDSLQTSGFNSGASHFTTSIGPVANPNQCLIDFVEGILLGGNHAQSEVAVECVGPGIGHVHAETRPLFFCIFHQISLALDEVITQINQAIIILAPAGMDARFCD